MTANKVSGGGKKFMILNKTAVENNVAVHLNDVIPCGFANGLVQYDGSLESIVFVPNM